MSSGHSHVTALQEAPAKPATVKPVPKHSAQCCMVARAILSRVGDKWSMLSVMILSEGAQRFNVLRRDIEGISQRMLTLTLRELERDGLVSRRVEHTVPPSVYYDLTPLGRTLLEPVKALGMWAQDNYPAISSSQASYDEKNPKK